jgi:hypothetical protein
MFPGGTGFCECVDWWNWWNWWNVRKWPDFRCQHRGKFPGLPDSNEIPALEMESVRLIAEPPLLFPFY